MTPNRITIPSGHISLEAEYTEGKKKEVCIVLHPHPQYGGSMDNNVVRALQRTLDTLGWSTLLYNSRGVGGSGGYYDNGKGESLDLVEVAGFAREKHPDSRLHIAAYSFGVWVVLKSFAEQRLGVDTLVLAAPPVDFVSFQGLVLPPVPTLVAVGDADGFCSLSSLEKWMDGAAGAKDTVSLEVISQCDHFFWGREKMLSEVVSQFAGTLTPTRKPSKTVGKS